MTAPTAPLPAPDLGPGRATLGHVIASEWIKLRTVRSTFWTLLSMFVVTVGFSALFCLGVAASYDQMSASDKASLDPTGVSLGGMMFGQLAIAVLGALVITSEYSTGGIRATLTAVPRRTTVLVAKGSTFLVLALVAGMATSFASFLLGQAILSTKDLQTALGDPEVLRAVAGGGLYLAGSGMFGFALGTLVRNTAGGITMAVAALLVLPLIVIALPGDWGDAIARYFTSNAGQQITVVHSTTTEWLSPWTGYAVFTAWWVVLLVAAGILMNRRDA